MPVARGEEHIAPGQGHHFLGQDICLDPAGLLPVIREAGRGPPPQALRQDQGQGVIQVAVGGAVSIQHAPGTVPMLQRQASRLSPCVWTRERFL